MAKSAFLSRGASFGAAAFAAALTLTGCSSDKLEGRPNLHIVSQGQAPEPRAADIGTAPVSFAIGPADRLAISVYGIPEATVPVTVDPSGQISVPIAGNIQAAGRTPSELTVQIAQRLRANHVRNPIVSVNVVEVLSQTVTVSGQVTRPGVYAVSGRVTLLGAIARAEGTTEFAKENYVVVFRTVNGVDYATLYDLRAIRAGLYADPRVFPSDTVVVGESRARRVFRDVLAASGLIVAPVTALAPRL